MLLVVTTDKCKFKCYRQAKTAQTKLIVVLQVYGKISLITLKISRYSNVFRDITEGLSFAERLYTYNTVEHVLDTLTVVCAFVS